MLKLPAYKIVQNAFLRNNFIVFSDHSNDSLIKEFSLNPYKKYFLFEDNNFSDDYSITVIFVGDYSSLKSLKYSSKTEARRDIQARYKNVSLDYKEILSSFWGFLYSDVFNFNKHYTNAFWQNIHFNNIDMSLNLLTNENISFRVTRKNTQDYKQYLVTLKTIKDRLNELNSALKTSKYKF